MAKEIDRDMTATEDMLERVKEGVEGQALRFPRSGFMIAASIAGWVLFWQMADRNQHNRHAQTMAWALVCVAIWLAYNY